MKKQEKLDVLNKGAAEKLICRCSFECEAYDVYLYPCDVNDKFLLAREEEDFLLNGYCIRKLSRLKKVELRRDKCSEIARLFGVTDGVTRLDMDFSSWRAALTSLMSMDSYAEIETDDGAFCIGRITGAGRSSALIRCFDADGVWADVSTEIPYSRIVTVKWDTRYGKYWRMYLDRTSDN